MYIQKMYVNVNVCPFIPPIQSHFNNQWIGFAGKILTGNHSDFPIKYGVFRLNFSLKPIH